MGLSPIKHLILEAMWTIDKPVKPSEIAKETGRSFPSTMMHIIGLTRMGYATSPEKGYYVITEKGKEALGFPKVDKIKVEEILAHLPTEKSFHFYANMGKPLNIYANNLQDFCDKISKIGTDSIEFHINRRDFEAWLNELGDVELARKIELIREKKLSGEELRRKVYETLESRCITLAKIAGQAPASE